ncbi:IS110 family transposase [Variovorax paradoxus]|jgi:transposase|uniref:IS110 family transposase n=1 Tax=Variovorax paradoxus TaxID=34073 RepID=UPI0004800C6F
MQEPTLCIGVDVSKAELVIAMGPERRPCSVANDAVSISNWLRAIPSHALIAMESTGRYHTLLAHLASQAGLKVYVLNARDVYFYARALGTRAKTDGVDAGVIARYLVEHRARLHPWQPGSSLQQRLQDLLARRAQVATHRSALRQVFTGIDTKGIETAKLQAAFDALLQSMDQQVQALIASDAQMAQGCERLRTITGIGPQTSALLATLLSRFDFANADALVAYSGLDPRPNDSGTKRGRRRLSKKGPPLLRRQMYLAGFAASHSKALKPLYQSIRAKGFATTAALMILGRKLLRVAFAIWKGNEVFDPARLIPKNDLQKT